MTTLVRRNRRTQYLAWLAVAVLLCGCGGDSVEMDWEGRWRAVVTLPGGELPFGLELSRGGAGVLAAHYINGAERVAVPDVSVAGKTLRLAMPAFNTWIEAEQDDGGMRGTLTLVKRGGEQQVMPFAATRAAYRFSASPDSAPEDLAGRWAVQFESAEGELAVGEFTQTGAELRGTFLTTTGDYRYLAGEVAGRELRLSTFDGSHAFLFTATLGDDGELQGDFRSGTKWHETWSARRDPDAKLADAWRQTFLKPGFRRVEFSFPDTTGNEVSLQDPRFKNKVVLVALAGAWCPNCHDEAAFLAPFYRKYRNQGVEIIGLMFEHLDDFDAAARQVDAFGAKFDIEYSLLLAGTSDKDLAGEKLPMLNRVLAFPTLLVLDRKGAVRRIHTGFTGPGTGEHYEKFVAEFTAFIEALLVEDA